MLAHRLEGVGSAHRLMQAAEKVCQSELREVELAAERANLLHEFEDFLVIDHVQPSARRIASPCCRDVIRSRFCGAGTLM